MVIFSNQNDLNAPTKKFLKTLKGFCHQSFKKIRIKDIQNKEISDLFNQRRVLRTKEDEWSRRELEIVEDRLAEKCSEQSKTFKGNFPWLLFCCVGWVDPCVSSTQVGLLCVFIPSPMRE